MNKILPAHNLEIGDFIAVDDEKWACIKEMEQIDAWTFQATLDNKTIKTFDCEELVNVRRNQ